MRIELLNEDGTAAGPFELTEVVAMIRAGRIRPSSFVRAEGATHWSRAERLGTMKHSLGRAFNDQARGVAADGPPRAAPGSGQAAMPEAPGSAATRPATSGAEHWESPAGRPQTYGTLRLWGRLLEAWGWRTACLAIAASIAAFLLALWISLGAGPNLLLPLCISLATGLGMAWPAVMVMRRGALGDRLSLLPIYLPIGIDFAVGALMLLAVDPAAARDEESLRLALAWRESGALLAWTSIVSLLLSIAGLLLVAAGEWLRMQADVGMNSWRAARGA